MSNIKIIISFLLILSTSILSGCLHNPSNISGSSILQAIQDTFMTSSIFENINDSIIDTNGIRESFGLSSSSDTPSIMTDITLGFTSDYMDKNKFSSLEFSGIIHDKIHNDILAGDAIIHYIQANDQGYIKRESGNINMGEGNTESLIIGMIIDSIREQRLLMDDNALIHKESFDVGFFRNVVSAVPVLKKLINTLPLTVSNRPIGGIFPTSFSKESTILQQFYDIIGKSYDPLKVSMQSYIQEKPSPQLVIQEFKDELNGFNLKGYIGIREGSISFSNDISIWNIERKEKKNSIILTLSQIKENSLQWKTNITLRNSTVHEAIATIAYNGDLSIYIPGYGSTQNMLTFPIAGLYSINMINGITINPPNRYVLMSQLFGDEYGILSLLESE